MRCQVLNRYEGSPNNEVSGVQSRIVAAIDFLVSFTRSKKGQVSVPLIDTDSLYRPPYWEGQCAQLGVARGRPSGSWSWQLVLGGYAA